MTWKAYDIIPIDWTWEFLPTVEEAAAAFARSDAARVVASGDAWDPEYLPQFFADFELAKELATAVGWEGDYQSAQTTPRVFFLPGEGEFQYAFAWKQGNNGTTFVISPHPLPWLQALT